MIAVMVLFLHCCTLSRAAGGLNFSIKNGILSLCTGTRNSREIGMEGNALFDEWQEKAVYHGEGPMMVLAGPGAGKTRVITYRIQYLIEEHGVNPSDILVVTFTKAAAEEMKIRFTALYEGMSLPVSFGTFHAVFFKILRYAYGYDASNILRDEDKRRIMLSIVREQRLEPDNEAEFVTELLNEISSIKGNDIPVNSYIPLRVKKSEFVSIYGAYEGQLSQANKIDFDDMLLLCRDLLRERPDILAIWQKKYRYLMVDEFQDINQVQYDVMKMLAAPEDNLVVVGDDDQSIYGFRGAKPELLFRFEKDYPKAGKILLPVNYRSTGEIVKSSLRLIEGNKNRYQKELKANREDGQAVIVQAFPDVGQEINYLLKQIRDRHGKGVPYGDMAVLFRTNAGAGYLTEQFTDKNIPFYCRERITGLYQHWISANVISYLKLAAGTGNMDDFLSVMNRPKRYISRDKLGEFAELKQNLYRAYSGKSWMMDILDKFFYDLNVLGKLPPQKAVSYLRMAIGYDKFIREYAGEKNRNEEEWLKILEELQEAAGNYQTFEEWKEAIARYEEELRKQSANRKPDSEHINVMTMHGSKGLEYPVVFLPQTNEGQIPHSRAVTEEELEEERRMFYVAMTRAKNELVITYVKERYEKPVEASRFVGELLNDTEGLSPGAVCYHKRYGRGKITRLTDTQMEVYFPSLKKKLLLHKNYVLSNQLLSTKPIWDK